MNEHSLASLVLETRAPGQRPLWVSLVLGARLAEAVASLHEQQNGGKVHGRLEPSVVCCTTAGSIRLENRSTRNSKWTDYAALEVQSGETPDRLSDVYSVGAMIYELTTGVSVSDVKDRYGMAPPPSRLRDGVDAKLDETIMASISDDPAERPYSVRQLKSELDQRFKVLEMPVESALKDFLSRLSHDEAPPAKPMAKTDVSPVVKKGGVAAMAEVAHSTTRAPLNTSRVVKLEAALAAADAVRVVKAAPVVVAPAVAPATAVAKPAVAPVVVAPAVAPATAVAKPAAAPVVLAPAVAPLLLTVLAPAEATIQVEAVVVPAAAVASAAPAMVESFVVAPSVVSTIVVDALPAVDAVPAVDALPAVDAFSAAAVTEIFAVNVPPSAAPTPPPLPARSRPVEQPPEALEVQRLTPEEEAIEAIASAWFEAGRRSSLLAEAQHRQIDTDEAPGARRARIPVVFVAATVGAVACSAVALAMMNRTTAARPATPAEHQVESKTEIAAADEDRAVDHRPDGGTVSSKQKVLGRPAYAHSRLSQ
jgi:hypothetical protein